MNQLVRLLALNVRAATLVVVLDLYYRVFAHGDRAMSSQALPATFDVIDDAVTRTS
ncbi:MAG TPA: hypothetical protein VI365_25240 [Trebonia sp.]